MTLTPASTAVTRVTTDSRFLTVVFLGFFGTMSAGISLACFGMAGLVWKDGQLWGSSSWDDEADLAIAMGLFFLAGWALQLLVAIIVALTGACRARGTSRRALLITAVAIPLISVALILIAAPIVMGQGGSQLIPLGEVG